MGGIDGPAPEIDESLAIRGAGGAQGGHGIGQGASEYLDCTGVTPAARLPCRSGALGITVPAHYCTLQPDSAGKPMTSPLPVQASVVFHPCFRLAATSRQRRCGIGRAQHVASRRRNQQKACVTLSLRSFLESEKRHD